MKSFTTPDFWQGYTALPLEIRQQAQKAYQLWQTNPLHPSLHFKKVGKNLWSARITEGYRALALTMTIMLCSVKLGKYSDLL